MPKLQVVDIFDNENLQIVTFEQCPSIIAIEAGFCPNLTKITGISNVQYLSAQYVVTNMNFFNVLKSNQQNSKVNFIIFFITDP